MTDRYQLTEQAEVMQIFWDMLQAATKDGGNKRAAGEKVSWKVDQHEAALFSHLAKWKAGRLYDNDSGAHPLVHLAWRALAIAWQERVAAEHNLSLAEMRKMGFGWEVKKGVSDCEC